MNNIERLYTPKYIIALYDYKLYFSFNVETSGTVMYIVIKWTV